MPDSAHDDPFADLFGQLPDPRSRNVRAGGEDAAAGSGAPPSAPDAAGMSDTGAPLSRRAAREAASRQGGAVPAPANTPAPAAPAPAAPAPVPASEPWIFGAAETASQSPYSRGRTAAPAVVTPTPVLEQPAPDRSPVPVSTATLEDLFSGNSTTDDLGAPPPPPDKRKRRIGGWIALGIVLLFLGGIAAGGWYVWSTYEDKIREVMGWEEPQDYEEGLATGEAFVTVASGDTGAPISQSLFDAGVTKTPDAFYDYLIETGQNPPFVPGVFKMQQQMTSEAALAALLDPANKMENTAQLREGLTVEQSLPLLAEGTGLPIEDFQAAVADPSAYGVSADSLEGWLFPATYTFNPDVTAPQVVQTLVDRTIQSLDAAGVPDERRQEILTTASIIQREVRVEDEMQKVSRVILNRLDPSNQETFGLLQMDSTAQYGAGEVGLTASTSEAAQNDPNPWNTYVHPGLPIGPISNPGDVAIAAAMNPAEGPWLYFVTVNMNTGETIFTETYSEHLRYVDQMMEWCAANPGTGC
jgi:UPF0755 protein